MCWALWAAFPFDLALSHFSPVSAPVPRKQENSAPTDEHRKENPLVNIRNEIKAIIVREGMTVSEVVEKMADQYGWSASVPNFSGKLRRSSLRYHEAVELADALGYDIIWKRRGHDRN